MKWLLWCILRVVGWPIKLLFTLLPLPVRRWLSIAAGWIGMFLFMLLPIKSHEWPVIGRVLGWWISASMWLLHYGDELRIAPPPRKA